MNGRKPQIRYNCVGYIDRRTQDLLDRYQQVEAARNAKSGRSVPLVGGVAEVGPGTTSRAGDSPAQPARIWPATAGAPFRVVSLR